MRSVRLSSTSADRSTRKKTLAISCRRCDHRLSLNRLTNFESEDMQDSLNGINMKSRESTQFGELQILHESPPIKTTRIDETLQMEGKSTPH